MTSDLDVNPTVGFIPTRLLTLAGLRILPSVSVPREAKASPIELLTPLQDQLPLGSIFGEYAPATWPPMALHPLLEFDDL